MSIQWKVREHLELAGAPLPSDAGGWAAGACPRQAARARARPRPRRALQDEQLPLAAVAAVEGDVFVSSVGVKPPDIFLRSE